MSLAAPGDCAEKVEATPKRRQIIDGAASVFNELGYDGASMSRIAEEAGVSKGTLYNYFVSKSDLFSAFVERETSRSQAWIMDIGPLDDEQPGGPREIESILKGIARRLIHTLISPSAQILHRIIISEAGKFPHLARIYYEAGYLRGTQGLALWLAEQDREGRLTIADPTLAAEQFGALCRTRIWMLRCLKIASETSGHDIDEIVDATVAMFLSSYGGRQDE